MENLPITRKWHTRFFMCSSGICLFYASLISEENNFPSRKKMRNLNIFKLLFVSARNNSQFSSMAAFDCSSLLRFEYFIIFLQILCIRDF